MAFRKLFFKRVQGIRDNYLLQEGDIALDEDDFLLYRGDGSTTGGIRISNDSAQTDVVSDTTPQLGGNLESNGNNIKMADNDKLLFGDSDDLEVFHNGSHSFIKDSGTGSLKLLSNNFNVRNVADTEHGITFTSGGAVELYHNGTKKFETASTGATVTGIFNIGDGSVSDNYIGLGAADDLKIFHNGSHSIIRETGTGSLYLQSDNNVIIGMDSSSETMIKGIANGSVELYHNNVKKFDTGSHGVDIVDEAHIEGATPHLTLKRTNNANVPTIRFKGSGGTVGATIEFDGTSGTTNELVFKSFPDSTLTEIFRVTTTGAKVTGNLEVTGAQIDFTALPTSDPGVAGRLWRSGNDVKISTG